ncbi:ABC transporter ATP-binding protein [Alkalinema pantanalense CENA528]|uniref:ABC transporter ATP-binding protein n=1 Tax=Alkalinema pantanalense TaxID=1620705 RepID=UPI003D6E36E5
MIEVEHLSKLYGATAAIQDITFSVESGEILGFLGPNGAGKTTTMRILSGYLPATSGTAKIAGFEVHEQSMEVRQRIGYLPENPPLYLEMTIEDFLDFVARIKGVSAGDRANRVNYALEKCNLTERRKTLIRKLSKGFKQRVGIAQAIVHDPPVIILDEPTVGLDPRQIIDVRNLIKGLAGDHTVILSTHILPEVSMTCDRVAIINQGRVVATNRTDELTTQMFAGSTYELEVEGDPDRVKLALDRITGITELEQLQPASQSSDPRTHWRVRAEAQEVGAELAIALVSNGLSLYEMRRVQASLEDVFLQLTTEEKVVSETSSEAELALPDDASPAHSEPDITSTQTGES